MIKLDIFGTFWISKFKPVFPDNILPVQLVNSHLAIYKSSDFPFFYQRTDPAVYSFVCKRLRVTCSRKLSRKNCGKSKHHLTQVLIDSGFSKSIITFRTTCESTAAVRFWHRPTWEWRRTGRERVCKRGISGVLVSPSRHFVYFIMSKWTRKPGTIFGQEKGNPRLPWDHDSKETVFCYPWWDQRTSD